MKHLLLALLLLVSPVWAQQGPQDLHPFFSPKGGCTQAVVSTLDTAKKTVLVQAYSFTSAPIAKALVDAKKRGVDVQVILDKSQITIPDHGVAEAFEQTTKPIIDRMVKSHEETQELTELRDWLLPMLMNGQVTVRS